MFSNHSPSDSDAPVYSVRGFKYDCAFNLHCKTKAVQVAIKWNSGSSVQVWYSATATCQMDSATDQDELKMKKKPEKSEPEGGQK